MTLSIRLQSAIRDLHDRIERLPVAVAMFDGTITKPAYAALMAQVRLVHLALESQLAEVPALTELAALSGPRADDVASDLEALGEEADAEAWPETVRFAETLDEWAGDAASLAGCLYVLEGSRMGSMVLAPRLSKALGAPMRPGTGLDYHIKDLPQRPMLFKRFKAALEALPVEAEAVAQAAGETMALLFDLYEAASAELAGVAA